MAPQPTILLMVVVVVVTFVLSIADAVSARRRCYTPRVNHHHHHHHHFAVGATCISTTGTSTAQQHRGWRQRRRRRSKRWNDFSCFITPRSTTTTTSITTRRSLLVGSSRSCEGSSVCCMVPLLYGWYQSNNGSSSSSSSSSIKSRITSRATSVHEVGDTRDHNNDTTASSMDDMIQQICSETIQLTEIQYQQIQQLTQLLCAWNIKLNLVSRQQSSNPQTLLIRHILPSLATYNHRNGNSVVVDNNKDTKNDDTDAMNTLANGALLLPSLFASSSSKSGGVRCMDVGTGGGFPGLPLAIQYPHIQFVLADSIGKKVMAVSDMAHQLQLSNVQTYHGRVEEYFEHKNKDDTPPPQPPNRRKFDIITGRSVTALPQFCSWIQHLIQPNTGYLVYWIGGTVESNIEALCIEQVRIQQRIPHLSWQDDDSDKRIMIFPSSAVQTMASWYSSSSTTSTRSKSSQRPRSQESNRRTMDRTTTTPTKRNGKRAKGEWQKKNRLGTDGPSRQRGYESFQRYSSSDGIPLQPPPSSS